jgi:hypothetical protein
VGPHRIAGDKSSLLKTLYMTTAALPVAWAQVAGFALSIPTVKSMYLRRRLDMVGIFRLLSDRSVAET